MRLNQIYLIHLVIIFLLLLVIYGSAQEQTNEEQPTQSFFFLSHSVYISPEGVTIDGENGTIIYTGDLDYPKSEILDIVSIHGEKAVVFSHGISGSVGYTRIKTDAITTEKAELGRSMNIKGINITYVGEAQGILGTYHIYNIDGKNITVDVPTTMKIGDSVFLFSVKQNTLEIEVLKPVEETVSNAMVVELLLGIVAVGMIIWTEKHGYGLFSH